LFSEFPLRVLLGNPFLEEFFSEEFFSETQWA